MSQLSFEQIQMLLSSRGVEALAAAGDAAGEMIGPAVVSRLRERFPAELVSAALTLVALRARARDRFSRAAGMFFESADLLEQATSEAVARHKAGRFTGAESAADLCCGAGGDSLAIAGCAGRVVGVDVSLARLACLRANADGAGVAEKVWQVASDVTRWVPSAVTYHIDPPRREAGVRQIRAEQWGEWLGFVEALTRKYRHVAGKLGPAVDPESLGWADEVEFISENGTLKQAVTWAGQLARHRRSATVIRSLRGETRAIETIASDEPLRTAEVGRALEAGTILYEPDPAVVRAGLLGNLAGRLGVGLVDTHLPLLVGTASGEETLLARPYEVMEVMGWSIKRVKEVLRAKGWRVAEVKTRAFACQPDEIWVGLKGLKAGAGEAGMVLWAVRLGSRPVGILARRGGRR